MIDAYSLPTTVQAGDQILPIRDNCDWRMVLDTIRAASDPELTGQERAVAALTIFYDVDLDTIHDPNAAMAGMMEILAAGEPQDGPRRPQMVDWDDDAPLIISGVNAVLGREVRAIPYMHWWTFSAAYMAIGDSVLSTVVSIRRKILKGKKLEKFEQDFRNENPQYFSNKRRAEQEHELLLELIGE